MTKMKGCSTTTTTPSVLWCCWLGGRKGIRPVKNLEWWGAGVVICLERDADLHTVQLMPLPLTISCFSKIQIGFLRLPRWAGTRPDALPATQPTVSKHWRRYRAKVRGQIPQNEELHFCGIWDHFCLVTNDCHDHYCYYTRYLAVTYWHQKMEVSPVRDQSTVTDKVLIWLHFFKKLSPWVDKPLKSVTHGQCDARPSQPHASTGAKLLDSVLIPVWWNCYILCLYCCRHSTTWQGLKRHSSLCCRSTKKTVMLPSSSMPLTPFL